MASRASALELPVPLLRRSDRIDRRRDVKWQQWPKTPYQQYDLDAESLKCNHPDLEDGSLIAWGLRQSQDAKGEGVEVDVLYGDGTDLSKERKNTLGYCKTNNLQEWPRNLNDDDLSRIMEVSRLPRLSIGTRLDV